MLVCPHCAVDDSCKARGKFLDNSEVKVISFDNSNILKDLWWKPPVSIVELYCLVLSHFEPGFRQVLMQWD